MVKTFFFFNRFENQIFGVLANYYDIGRAIILFEILNFDPTLSNTLMSTILYTFVFVSENSKEILSLK